MDRRLRTPLLCLALMAAGCDDEALQPLPNPADITFSQSVIDLGQARTATIQLINSGELAVGPIDIEPGPVRNQAGATISEAQLRATPNLVSTLNPGSSVAISLSLEINGAPSAGDYSASASAVLDDQEVASLDIAFAIVPAPPTGQAASVEITTGPASVTQGDVEQYVATTLDAQGQPVSDPSLTWSIVPGTAGLIAGDGRFVSYTPGAARIVATVSNIADTLDIAIASRSIPTGNFSVVGQGSVSQFFTSDVWVHGSYAYTGTWSCRGNCGNTLHVWEVSNPAAPTLRATVTVDARTVNDIKIRADGQIGVMTHEISNDGLNGITLLDTSSPASTQVIKRFTDDLESGVHNVWIEGNYVYIVVDGVGSGLRIMDISNPSSPSIVAQHYVGTSFLHDVYVRNGIAFLSQWGDGLVLLDVGNGVVGGSPTNPQEIGRVMTAGGETHNAWYWPAAGYVFVGEEDFGLPPGTMHVVDVRNPSNPVEVATFRVPGDTPHNFWLDEGRGILYMAWYTNGLRAVDVSGELMGELDKQGREIASSQYGTGFGCSFQGGSTGTCTWAPQLHNGLIYASDLNTGLWVLQPNF